MNIFDNFECKNPVQKAYFFGDMFFLKSPQKSLYFIFEAPNLFKKSFFDEILYQKIKLCV